MRLNHWAHSQKEIEFDTCEGVGQILGLDKPRDHKSRCSGFSAKEKHILGQQEYFAIVQTQVNTLFYAGKQCWILGNTNLELQHKRIFPFLCTFQVIESGVVKYSIIYSRLLRSLGMFIDPTYDKIDQDSDFFLEFVAETCNTQEWLEHAKSSFEPART
jgi:hypothetical protein